MILEFHHHQYDFVAEQILQNWLWLTGCLILFFQNLDSCFFMKTQILGWTFWYQFGSGFKNGKWTDFQVTAQIWPWWMAERVFSLLATRIWRVAGRMFCLRANCMPVRQLQSADRRYQSTETCLVHLLNSVYHAAGDGLVTLLLSLDLSASLHTSNHYILLKRLSNALVSWD